MFALTSWLDRRAYVVPASTGGSPTLHPRPSGIDERSFPLLSSGSAQLALLRERFPEGRDPALYREGLNRILQWFPDEPDTVFEARMYLALIGWTDDTDPEVIVATTHLLDQFGGRVTLDNRAWAEYINARARFDNRGDPAALDILRRLVDDERLGFHRRTWSAYYLALYVAESDPETAIALLERFADYDESARDPILDLLARLLAEQGDAGEIVRFFERLTRLFSATADTASNQRIDALEDVWPDLPPDTRNQIFEAMTEWLSGPSGHLPAATLQRIAKLDPHLFHLREQLALKVREQVEKHPLPWMVVSDEATAASSVDELIDAMEAADNAGDAEAVVRYSVAVISSAQEDYDQFAKACHYAMWRLHDQTLSPELFDILAGEIRHLPPDAAGSLFNATIAAARGYAIRGENETALAFAEWVGRLPEAPPYLRVGAWGRVALIGFEMQDLTIGFEMQDLDIARQALRRCEGKIRTPIF